jgi:Skp family chaperone for outer membrane proteins
MNRFRKLAPALVLVTLAAVVLSARPGSTASSKPSASGQALGFVDMEAVAANSVVGQTTRKNMEALKTRFQDELERKKQVAYLTADQRKELDALQAKTDKSDADKARFAELQGLSAKMEQELLELSQKTNITEVDRKRIDELSKLAQAGRDQFEKDKEQAQNQLDEQAGVLVQQLTDRITKAVEEVAKKQDLAMVVHKEARIFGGLDITEAVVERLKK